MHPLAAPPPCTHPYASTPAPPPCSHPPMLPPTHAPTLPCSHPPMLPPSHARTLPYSHPPMLPPSHAPTPHYLYLNLPWRWKVLSSGKVRVRAHLTLTSPELNLTRMAWTQLCSLYILAEALPVARASSCARAVMQWSDWLTTVAKHVLAANDLCTRKLWTMVSVLPSLSFSSASDGVGLLR